MTQPSVFGSLQLYRGIAAVLVVAFHCARHVDKISSGMALEPFFAFGDSGVQFFFVLSGFIIHYSCRRITGQPKALKTYLWKRLTRIYPPYKIILSGLALAYLLVPGFGEPRHRDLGYFAKNFLLIPQGRDPYLGIAWTLVYEMFFYFLFAAVIVRAQAIWVVSAILLALAVSRPLVGESFHWLFFFLCNPNLLLFLCGMLASVVLQRFDYRTSAAVRAVLLCGGVILYAASALFIHESDHGAYPSYDLSVAAFGIASTLIVIGSIGLKTHFGGTLGEASYSVYLIHIPVIALGSKFLGMVIPVDAWSSISLFLVLGAAATLIGVGFYKLVERPILDFLRTLAPR